MSYAIDRFIGAAKKVKTVRTGGARSAQYAFGCYAPCTIRATLYSLLDFKSTHPPMYTARTDSFNFYNGTHKSINSVSPRSRETA